MVLILRSLTALAMLYNAWIIFRVVDGWVGSITAVGTVVLYPISAIVMPIVMLLPQCRSWAFVALACHGRGFALRLGCKEI